MRIISWNVNGIRAVHGKDGFEWLKDDECDIFCMQEIKALEEQFPKDLTLNGIYNNKEVNSAAKKGYSGTATFSNPKASSTSFAPHIDLLDEGRIIEQDFNDFILFNIYFPNGQKDDERLDYKMAFYDRFLEHIIKLRDEGKSIVVCGDVNTAHKEIDLKHPKANSKKSGFLPIEREWMDKLVSNGFIDTFRYVHGDVEDAYSWWSYRMAAREKNVGWRIDYFFISEDLCEVLSDAFILDGVMGSDHCPVGIELDI